MTARRPLVLIGGKVSEMPSGDILSDGIGFDPTNPLSVPQFWDDFEVASIETGEIGVGWSFSNGSVAVNGVTPEDNHPGIIQRLTATTSSQVCSMNLGSASGVVNKRLDSISEMTWIVKPEFTNADFDIMFGMSTSLGTNPAADGIWIERRAADGSWYGVCRSGNSQTRTTALSTFVASWSKQKIRRIDSTHIGFSCDGGTEQVLTSNIPTGSTAMALGNNISLIAGAVTQRSFLLDFMSFKGVAPTR